MVAANESMSVLYDIDTDFKSNNSLAQIKRLVRSRDNFIVVGPANIGKTQLVYSAVARYFDQPSRYMTMGVKEDLKKNSFNVETLILDDFEFSTFTHSEMIALLDRDKQVLNVCTEMIYH